MTSPILQWPVSSTIIAICSLWWFYTWNYRFDLGRVSYNFHAVVEEKQWWRIVTSSFTHANVLHLTFNMLSLWSLGPIEAILGHVVYLKYSFLLMFLSELVVTGIAFLLIYKFQREHYRLYSAVGYSGVVFGWMALISVNDPLGKISFLGVFPIYRILYPFVSMILTQAIVPQASLIGHASGILVGFLIGLGLFRWFTDYLFYISLFWAFIFLILNAKHNSTFRIPCLTIEESDSIREFPRRRVING